MEGIQESARLWGVAQKWQKWPQSPGQTRQQQPSSPAAGRAGGGSCLPCESVVPPFTIRCHACHGAAMPPPCLHASTACDDACSPCRPWGIEVGIVPSSVHHLPGTGQQSRSWARRPCSVLSGCSSVDARCSDATGRRQRLPAGGCKHIQTRQSGPNRAKQAAQREPLPLSAPWDLTPTTSLGASAQMRLAPCHWCRIQLQTTQLAPWRSPLQLSQSSAASSNQRRTESQASSQSLSHSHSPAECRHTSRRPPPPLVTLPTDLGCIIWVRHQGRV